MNGVIKEWTDGRVGFKMPVSWGPEQELDILSNHCFFFVLFFVLGFRNLQRRVFIKENPADMKTVRYCFVTFYLNFRFSLHFVLPHSHFRAVGTTQSPFFLVRFSLFFPTVGGREATNMATCKRTLTLLSETCIAL